MDESLCVPDGLTMKRHRDLTGRRWHEWIRRGCLALVAVVCALALLNVFGQHPELARTASGPATLEIYAPTRVRGGLLFQARFTITATQELKDARLVLDRGWADGFQLNTIEPSPLGEASADGRLSFDLGHVPAGDEHVLWLQFQVDPTIVGHRAQDVRLFDGETLLLTRDRDLFVFP
jgi:hypothetical protein